MFCAELSEGFIPVTSKEQAEELLKDGYVYYDTGMEELIIAKKDMPLAIANTPVGVDAKIIDTSRGRLDVVVTTFGNFVNRCNIDDMPKKLAFLNEVVKYQQSDELVQCYYIPEDSEFDPNN